MKPRFVSKKDADQGYVVYLVDDAGNRTDWAITVVGADSTIYRNKQRELQVRNIAGINRARRLFQSPEAIEADARELVVAATVAWSGIELDDQEAPFTPDNARRLYLEIPSIYEQVDRAINERANFLPSAASSS